MDEDTVAYPQPKPTRIPPDPAAIKRARGTVIAIAIALVGCSIGFRAVQGFGLGQTAVLFVGLPAILAIAVAMTPPARTVTGLIFKTSTVVMLLAGILLGETLICMVIASPLVYLVGVAVGAPMDRARRARARGESGHAAYAIVGIVLLAGLEGAVPGLDLPRDASVTVTRHVAGTPDEVAAALATTPDFRTPRPALLRIGFPRPVRARGEGLAVGSRRWITITGSDHYGTTHTGDLVMEVTARGRRRVEFTAVHDSSRVADWLRWERADVTWEPEGDGTRVSWTLHYERQLAPSWYFGPVQRGAATLSAAYLIAAAATPHG